MSCYYAHSIYQLSKMTLNFHSYLSSQFYILKRFMPLRPSGLTIKNPEQIQA